MQSFGFAGDYTSSDDAIDRVGIDRFSLNPSFRASFGDTDLVVRGSYSDVKQLEYAGLKTLPISFSAISSALSVSRSSAGERGGLNTKQKCPTIPTITKK